MNSEQDKSKKKTSPKVGAAVLVAWFGPIFLGLIDLGASRLVI